jgi:hypothetical protein
LTSALYSSVAREIFAPTLSIRLCVAIVAAIEAVGVLSSKPRAGAEVGAQTAGFN